MSEKDGAGMAPRWIDASVLAREFGVTGATIRNWIASGRVQATKTPGGRWKITPQEYRRLTEKLSQTSQTPQIELT